MKMLVVSALVVCVVATATAELREMVGPVLMRHPLVKEQPDGECSVLLVIFVDKHTLFVGIVFLGCGCVRVCDCVCLCAYVRARVCVCV